MLNRKSIFLLIVIVFQLMHSVPLRASFEGKEVGSAYLGRGGSGVAALSSSFTVCENPAALSFTAHRQLDFFFKNYYGLSGLNQMAVGLAFKPFGVPVGLGFWQYGNKLYHETALRLAGAWRFGECFSLALQGDVLNLWVKNYGSATTVGLGMAALYRINEQFNIGLRMENLNRPIIGQARETLPLHVASGISFAPLPSLKVFADMVKESDSAFDYRFGVEYQSNRWLELRGGFRTLTNSYAAGVSFYAGKVRIDYGFEYHPQLSFSHSVSVGYEF